MIAYLLIELPDDSNITVNIMGKLLFIDHYFSLILLYDYDNIYLISSKSGLRSK